MLSVSWIKVCVLLVLFNPVASKLVKMTGANEPEKLKAAVKFEGGHVYVDNDAKFLVEPESSMFEFEFLSGCEKSIKFDFQSFKFLLSKESLIKKQGRRTITLTSTGTIGGTVEIDLQSGKFLLENGRVLLHLELYDKCRIELVKGTPLLDDAESQLIGGLTPVQLGLAVVLPVAGAGLLITVIFLSVKRVQKNEKRNEKEQKFAKKDDMR